MRLSTSIEGSWGNTTNWLKKMTSNRTDRVLHEIGRLGVEALRDATPVGRTGETANGWKPVFGNNEVGFINTAHPEESVNIAKIKELGHGTRNGGYAPPRPYMKKAMRPVWKKASDLIDKELKS